MAASVSHPDGHALSSDFVNSRPFELLSRAGFLARGAVYGIIGAIALKLALGGGGQAADQQGAMKTLAHQPFGKILLLLLAVGLGGYACWRFTRAALGRGPEGVDRGFERAAAFASGLVYMGFCLLALEILLGMGRSAQTGNPKTTTAGVLSWPAGTLLVGLAGLVFVAVGGFQAYRGATRKFLEDSKTEEMRPEVRRWIARIGTTGHLARAVIFGLVGWFLIKAAVEYNGREAVGLDGALAKLAHQNYGHLMLGFVAVGLIAFSLYSISDARYRRI